VPRANLRHRQAYLTRMTVVRRQNAPYSLVEHGDRYSQEQEGVSAPNAKSDM